MEAHLAHHPVGQHRDAAVRGDEEQDHRGELHLPHGGRLHPGRRQELRENVEPRPVDRVGDQRLPAEILGVHEGLCRERVLGRGHEDRRVVEERLPGDPRQRLGIGRDHEVDRLAPERRQRLEGEPRPDVDVDLGPGAPERLEHRKQPLETGMALDRDVHPPRLARAEPREIGLERRHLGQHPLGQPQELLPSGREPHRLRAAHEELDPDLRLEPFHLMGKRRLGDVELLGRPGEPAGRVDRLDRLQVPEFEIHGVRLMMMMRIMSLSHR